MLGHDFRWDHLALTRRELLARCGMGLGSLALGPLLSGKSQAGSIGVNPLAARPPHFAAKAKHVIHLFMNGGPSHVDTFDPKPLLAQYAGKNLPGETLKTERPTGAAFPSPFKFQKYGQSGIEVSELFAHTAESIDEIAVIRSMYADVPNHEPSLSLMNCGTARQIRPSFGSWVTYGLGTDNQNLPAFVAMCPGGYPIQESQNWQAAFLPGVFQGTYLDTQHTAIEKLIEHIRNDRLPLDPQRRQLDLLQQLNRRHQEARQQDAELEARIQSFELAFRMQTEAAEVFDVSREPQHILDMYGPGVQARQILIARRLVERGVRFVQLWHGAGQPWDNHDDIEVRHRAVGQGMRPGHRGAAERSEAARAAGRNAGDLGRRIRPHADCRDAETGRQCRQDQRPRPQSLRLYHVAGRRRSSRRLRPRRDRRVRISSRRQPRPRA